MSWSGEMSSATAACRAMSSASAPSSWPGKRRSRSFGGERLQALIDVATYIGERRDLFFVRASLLLQSCLDFDIHGPDACQFGQERLDASLEGWNALGYGGEA